MPSPPGPELLGVITSHGPFRESTMPSRKARGRAAFGTPAADAPVSAERMRTALSSPAGAAALLQSALPGGGAEMVAVEGPAEVPGHHGRQSAAERPKRALPGAGAEPETAGARSSSRGCEGNHCTTFFSIIGATGQVVTRDSCASGEVPYNATARRRAGVRWSASRSGSGAGKGRAT